MKITKEQLRQMILEEVEASATPDDEQELGKGKMSTADARKTGMERAKQAGAAGIQPQERDIIDSMQKKLMAAAQEGNIASGTALRIMKRLAHELKKLTK